MTFKDSPFFPDLLL